MNARPGSLVLLQQLRAYKAELREQYPGLADPSLDTWPLLEHDALALFDFIELLPRPQVVLDIGTFTGMSAFALALNPNVSRVVSVDPNPTVHEQVNEQASVVGKTVDAASLGDVRVLDVARSVLGAFPEAAAKVEILEGVVASPDANSDGNRVDLAQRLDGAEDVLAMVDGLHTRDGVLADLEAIFAVRPEAIAAVDDCRYAWGPYVQAGIADFLQQRRDYRFQLLADLSPSFARSNVGLVYAGGNGDDVGRALAALQRLYMSFDPLTLVAREEELQRIVAETHERLEVVSGERDEWRRAFGRLERSFSWKLTRPLRWAKGLGRPRAS